MKAQCEQSVQAAVQVCESIRSFYCCCRAALVMHISFVHGEPRNLVPNGRAISNTELSIPFKISRTSRRKVIHDLFLESIVLLYSVVDHYTVLLRH